MRRSFYVKMLIVYSLMIPVFGFSSENEGAGPWSSFDYSHYKAVLDNYVNQTGMVDYAGLKEKPDDLNSYLDQIAALERQSFNQWSRNEKLAFWINAYNGITLKAIVDHYPIKSSFLGSFRFPENSIRQIDGVWDELTHEVMGQPMTLDQIEHETIRVEFNEPRIHFAVNCASMGCPKLKNEVYVGAKLDQQLDEQTEWFVSTAHQFKIEGNTVYLSKILYWYGEDFVSYASTGDRFPHLGGAEKGVMNFLYPYLTEEQQNQIEGKKINIAYLDYDWSLNEQAE